VAAIPDANATNASIVNETAAMFTPVLTTLKGEEESAIRKRNIERRMHIDK
jgi:hypothetical protein